MQPTLNTLRALVLVISLQNPAGQRAASVGAPDSARFHAAPGVVLDRGQRYEASAPTRMYADSDYMALLKSTNEMLAMRWTPMGTFVAALGVLFTAGAIVATVVIYLQSREYRSRMAEAQETLRTQLDGYRSLFDSFVREKADEIAARIKILQEENTRVSAEAAEKNESEMKVLRERLEHIAKPPPASWLSPNADRLLTALQVDKEIKERGLYASFYSWSFDAISISVIYRKRASLSVRWPGSFADYALSEQSVGRFLWCARAGLIDAASRLDEAPAMKGGVVTVDPMKGRFGVELWDERPPVA